MQNDAQPPDPAPHAVPPATGPRPPPPAQTDWLHGAPVTRAIVALNVAVFALQVLLAFASTRSLPPPEVPSLAELVAHVPTRESLLFGANYAIATVREHRIETLVTACFLHAGIVHLGLNMLVLWQGGALVERAVGAARFASMYVLAGVVSSALSAGVSWARGEGHYSLGASGAIMGVLAAALVIGWRVQGWHGRLTQAMVRWLGFNLVFGLLVGVQGANIDNAAHIGGAVAGAIVAALWRRGVVYSAKSTALVLAACAALLFGAGVAVAVRDARDPFAAMLADERFEEAGAALAQRDCQRAADALRATERIAPRAVRLRSGAVVDVRRLRADVDVVCRRPM